MNRRALLAGLFAMVVVGPPESAQARRRKSGGARSGGSRRSRGGGSVRRSGSGSGASYYPNCAAARADGAAPIRKGDPGYSRKLDRDGDGVACE